MKEVWVEKYRPSKLSEVVGQTDITERLTAYAETKSMPHLLFAGPGRISFSNGIDVVLPNL